MLMRVSANTPAGDRSAPAGDATAPARDRRSPAKKQAILAAATTSFLANGFARTSVDAVAASAGVGKQTVYSHFGDKEQLFLAAVAAARDARPGVATPAKVSVEDPSGGLRRLAVSVIDAVLDPTLSALRRLTIAELPHHAQLQDLWGRSTAPDPAFRDVTAFFAACAEHGTLRVASPQRSARQFVFLLATEARTATAQGYRPLPPRDRRRIVDDTVDLFLRAHAA